MERKDEVQSGMEELRRMMESLQADVAVFKKVVLHGCPSYADVGPKVRFPEPKGFRGNHNPRNLGIFYGTWSSSSRLLMYQIQKRSLSPACIL